MENLVERPYDMQSKSVEYSSVFTENASSLFDSLIYERVNVYL